MSQKAINCLIRRKSFFRLFQWGKNTLNKPFISIKYSDLVDKPKYFLCPPRHVKGRWVIEYYEIYC